MEEMSDKERERGRLPGQTPGRSPLGMPAPGTRSVNDTCAARLAFFFFFAKKRISVLQMVS
jgi:hypothetical protein